ncbi:MAG: TonB-dependent receptor [Bacteroides sp.]|nr:TonB-dependent receptor [Bacteroides sp.]
MRRNLIHFLLVALLSVCSSAAFGQITVKGQLVDEETGEPLVGAAVMVEGTSQGSVTDIDGYFNQSVGKNATLVFKYVGYKDLTRKITQKGNTVDLGVIRMKADAVMLGDVVITSSIAVARKTPVALSSVDPVFIEEKLGTQEFPEVLKSTPGVHANKQGGGYGDSEIYMRGFDNSNIGVMINGVPMNDMEWGGIYWSNWAGLSDVTRSMQTQRGLGASKVSIPSVGGTINIVTNGLEAKKGGNIAYSMGNDGMNKILFTVSTGLSQSGWAMTLLGAKTWGDGYIQGTSYTGYNYFLNIAKRINDNHQLSFTVFGAPQEHDQRSNSYGGLTIADWKMVEQVYGVKDYKYNATFGYRANGQAYNSAHNVYHKPQISLNHQWQIDEKSSLSTSLYVSIGRGYGNSGQGNSEFSSYSYSSWRGAYKGTLYDTFRNSDGTFDYAAIEEINANSEYGSALIMSKSKNYHNWYGLLSTYTTKFGENIDFYGGIDFRYYKGTHTNEITDLFGGAYYLDTERADVLAANNSAAADASWKYEKLGVGDVVYRDYDGHVMQEGVFFQGEYNKDKLSAFVAGSVSNTGYWRYDRFYYDKEHAKSNTVNFMGFTVKGGANYNLNDYHNVFANVGYISRAPKFSYGAFMSSTTSNLTNKDAVNEKIFSAELGYGFHNPWATVNVNLYYTKWMDKTMTNSTTLSNQETGYINLSGVDALHKGGELEIKLKPLHWLELTGMFSYGDWKWDSSAKGYYYNGQEQPVNEVGNVVEAGSDSHAWSVINLKGIRVGGSAQTTAAIGANINISKDLRVGADWTYYGRNYAYYVVDGTLLDINEENTTSQPWKIPAASQIDVNASYKFKIGGLNATLSGNVNNLLNYYYISKAWNPSSGTATQDNVYVFYSFGRTYSVRLKVNF